MLLIIIVQYILYYNITNIFRQNYMIKLQNLNAPMKKTGIVKLSRPRFGKRSPATSVHPRIKRLKSLNPLTTARIYIYLLDNYGIGIPMSKHTKVPRSGDNPEVAESFSKLSRPRFGKRRLNFLNVNSLKRRKTTSGAEQAQRLFSKAYVGLIRGIPYASGGFI